MRQGAKFAAGAQDILNDFSFLYENINVQKINTMLISRGTAGDTVFPEQLESKSEQKTHKENKTEENNANETFSSFSAPSDDEPTDYTKNLTASEQLIMDTLMLSPIHADVVCELTGLSPNIVNSSLTLLEMRGLVSSQPGKFFSLKV